MSKGRDLNTGLVLVIVGLFFFGARYFDNIGILILPMMGLGFVAASLISRNIGLLIPGGILSGIGLGVFLMESSWITRMELTDDGGVFLVSFALGWFLITGLSIVVFRQPMLWPMIPGGIMGFIGMALLINEAWLSPLENFGSYWPLILVAVGISIIWKNFRKDDQLNEEQVKSKEEQYDLS